LVIQCGISQVSTEFFFLDTWIVQDWQDASFGML
jgi:hypothetical protein